MITATHGQKIIIDSRRHSTECKHPPAEAFTALEFLACRRCGTTYVDGRVLIEPAILEADDPPDFTYVSSYMGELAEDVASAIAARAESTLRVSSP